MEAHYSKSLDPAMQMGTFFFHVTKDRLDIKLMGQTKSTLCNAFTVFIYGMLTSLHLSFLPPNTFPTVSGSMVIILLFFYLQKKS